MTEVDDNIYLEVSKMSFKDKCDLIQTYNSVLDLNYSSNFCFDDISLMSCWNRSLIEDIISIYSLYFKSLGYSIILLPKISGNSCFYSCSKFLIGEVLSSVVLGIQKEDLVASIGSFPISLEDSNEKYLRENDLLIFNRCLKLANIKSIYVEKSVEKIETEDISYFINDILKEEWGFKGFVISYGFNRKEFIRYGFDQFFSRKKLSYSFIKNSIKKYSIRVTDVEIDEKVFRILRTYSKIKKEDNDFNIENFENKKEIYLNKLSKESMVLLKNRDNILPLKNLETKIAVVGNLKSSIDFLENYNSNVFFVKNFNLKKFKSFDLVTVIIDEKSFNSKGLLIGRYKKLISNLKSINKKVILVDNTAKSFYVEEWIQDVDVLLKTFSYKKLDFSIIFDLLMGKFSPSAKLPFNLYFKNRVDIAFEFGFGLSYTDFEFSDFTLSRKEISIEELKKIKKINITFSVKNMGRFSGAEVIQLYIFNDRNNLEIDLKNFKKIFLDAGENKLFDIDFSLDDLLVYNKQGNWVLEAGSFDIVLASSYNNILYKNSFVVK